MNKFITESKRHFTPDYALIFILVCMGALSISGIIMAGPLLNQLTVSELLTKQIMWFVISIAAVYFLIRVGIDRLFSFAYVLYWILLALLAFLIFVRFTHLDLSFAHQVSGSYAWYQIPFIGSFQPSEFMKIVLVVIAANIIDEHNRNKTSSDFSSDFQLILKIGKYAAPALILNILQPDTGVPIIILVSLAMIFFVSGVRREWSLVIGGLTVGLLIGIVWLYYNNPELLNRLVGGGSNSYRLNRFYGWLDYEKYADTDGYQLYSALLAIGTAGLTGHPFMSVITLYPEAQTDFIFAVLTQNLGFIGGIFIIILCFSLDFKLLHTALNSDLTRDRYMLIGIVGMLTFQHVENMGMILGLLPITGITLPFISYGGSSMLSYMIPIAVALHVYSETQNAHRH